MTIDPETKKYIDTMMTEHSIKVSSLLSCFMHLLEEKGITKREDFDTILERARNMSSQAMAIGSMNFLAFAHMVQEAERLKKEGLDKSNWDDLK